MAAILPPPPPHLAQSRPFDTVVESTRGRRVGSGDHLRTLPVTDLLPEAYTRTTSEVDNR